MTMEQPILFPLETLMGYGIQNIKKSVSNGYTSDGNSVFIDSYAETESVPFGYTLTPPAYDSISASRL